MLGIGTPELMVIGLVLLLLYGPDRLPKMLAKVSGFVRDIKSAGQDVTRTVQNELYKVETQVQTLALDEQAQPRSAKVKSETPEPTKPLEESKILDLSESTTKQPSDEPQESDQ